MLWNLTTNLCVESDVPDGMVQGNTHRKAPCYFFCKREGNVYPCKDSPTSDPYMRAHRKSVKNRQNSQNSCAKICQRIVESCPPRKLVDFNCWPGNVEDIGRNWQKCLPILLEIGEMLWKLAHFCKKSYNSYRTLTRKMKEFFGQNPQQNMQPAIFLKIRPMSCWHSAKIHEILPINKIL